MYSSGISRREEDARRVAVDVAERALQEEGDPWRGTSTAKDPWDPSRHTVTLNTPPQIPTHTFPLSPFETPPPVKPTPTMRATAPIFTPPRTHTRTQSDLLPAIDLSPAAITVSESTTHRRTVSVESPADEPRTGNLPFPRTTTAIAKRTRKAGMPTLAEITAYYATKRRPGGSSSASLSSASSSPPSHPRTARGPSRRPLPPGGLAMLKRCSLSSDTSTDYSSSADSDGPQTPPASEDDPGALVRGRPQRGERRESASRLPVFLRGGPGKDSAHGKYTHEVRGGYNALASALARHGRTTTPPPPARGSQTPPPGSSRMLESPRRSSSLDATTISSWPHPSTPGIQVTPPSCTIPPSPTFALRPVAPTKPSHGSATTLSDAIPSPAPGAPSICTSLNVPGFRITPPTASAGQDDTSPLRRLEAEIAARQAGGSTRKAGGVEGIGKREERSERMMRILGKRVGGGTA